MKVLITGGAGYIGGTVASACLDNGIDVVILDDLSTGREEFAAGRAFYQGDISDAALIDRIVADHPDLSLVVHCAASVVVPDSVAHPLAYYENNVGKTIAMLRHLERGGIDRVIFSSSASIYAADDGEGVDEASAIAPASPYANTKAVIERVLEDSARAGELRAISLRYFNPIGADPQLRSGLQNPTPSHALGKLIEAARERRAFVIAGEDWPTRDGSGLRDFVHVWDLAQAHLAAIREFDAVVTPADPYCALNVGTGVGTTVRELAEAFQRVTGDPLAVEVGPPRPGDVAGAFAVTDLAAQRLHWRSEKSVDDGIRDSLAWSKKLAALDEAR